MRTSLNIRSKKLENFLATEYAIKWYESGNLLTDSTAQIRQRMEKSRSSDPPRTHTSVFAKTHKDSIADEALEAPNLGEITYVNDELSDRKSYLHSSALF